MKGTSDICDFNEGNDLFISQRHINTLRKEIT